MTTTAASTVPLIMKAEGNGHMEDKDEQKGQQHGGQYVLSTASAYGIPSETAER